MKRAGLAMLLVLAAAHSEGKALPVRPAPEKLVAWTTALRDRQPENAFAAVYNVGDRRLVFVGAQHANRIEAPTFRLIEGAFANFRFHTVIAEGFPTSRGPNPASTLKYARDDGPRPDGFVEAGELFPTVVGAQKQRALLWGGEADDLTVKTRLLAKGISGESMLGFYVLRNIPQWVREERITNAGDPRLAALVETALVRNRLALQLPPTALPDFGAWSAWYHRLNRKPIGKDFAIEEVGPLADGKFGSNAIAYAISRERAVYLHNLIVHHLNRQENVLVVFGASHLMIHQPALDRALGSPCYVGTEMKAAQAACR